MNQPELETEVLVFWRNSWRRGYLIDRRNGEPRWCVEGRCGFDVEAPSHWTPMPEIPNLKEVNCDVSRCD